MDSIEYKTENDLKFTIYLLIILTIIFIGVI